MAQQKDYPNIEPKTLDCLKSELQSMGITPPEGDSGTIDYQGVKLQVTYQASAQTLSVEMLQKPVFIPESLVWQLLDGRVQRCIGNA